MLFLHTCACAEVVSQQSEPLRFSCVASAAHFFILIFIKKKTLSSFYSALWRVENRMRRQLRQQLVAAAGGIFSIKSVDFLLKNSIRQLALGP